MRAGMISIKVPISAIWYEDISDDVTYLRESICAYGLLQPVGIVRRDAGYKLLFGRRRIKACRELGMKYIHAILLTAREDEEKIFAAEENIQHKETDIATLTEYALSLNGGSIEEGLCISQKSAQAVSSYLKLSDEAKENIKGENEFLIEKSNGDSEYFIKMCRLLDDVPVNAKDKIRLSVLSDKRIFINEIEKILKLMRIGGYTDSISENEECIIIKKVC